MASQPPESLIVGQFTGIRNTVSEERLQPGDLASAVNVDIDDAGQLRRRRGYRLLDAGDHHSLKAIAGQLLVVRSGTLGRLFSDMTFAPLVDVGPDQLSYASVASTIYFSSRSASGKIIGDAVRPWGEHGGAGDWISPVIRPTETLGPVRGRILKKPPLATEIEACNGRIYLAQDHVIWATELYLYDRIDLTKNYLQMEDPVTMLAGVNDGIYVGTTAQLLFLKGTLAKGFQLQVIANTPVARGSCVQVPVNKVHPDARKGPMPEAMAQVFMTGDGIFAGFDGGHAFPLTADRMTFPGVDGAAALYREDSGANTYVAVTNRAGGPAANARIGDYVDAEIVRASQGG